MRGTIVTLALCAVAAVCAASSAGVSPELRWAQLKDKVFVTVVNAAQCAQPEFGRDTLTLDCGKAGLVRGPQQLTRDLHPNPIKGGATNSRRPLLARSVLRSFDALCCFPRARAMRLLSKRLAKRTEAAAESFSNMRKLTSSATDDLFLSSQVDVVLRNDIKPQESRCVTRGRSTEVSSSWRAPWLSFCKCCQPRHPARLFVSSAR
jgi:hypothetical protein